MITFIENSFKIAFANEITVAEISKPGFRCILSGIYTESTNCVDFAVFIFRTRREKVTKSTSHSGRRVYLKKKERSWCCPPAASRAFR